MGCCLSSDKPESPPSKPHLSKPNSSPKGGSSSRAPPPSHPLPEEETVVKEVLSETPISRFPENEPTKDPPKHSSPKPELHLEEPKKVVPQEEVPEEVSEICSTLSESCVSTATTATTATAATAEMNNAAEDDNEVTQVKTRRVAKDRLVGRPQKGHSRRSETLPGRVRAEASPGRVRSGLRDGRGQNINGMRRGSVMGPERRSRSPVTRVDGPGLRSGLGRCPSGRRTGKSPGRVGPPALVEKNPKSERVDPKVENGDTVAKLDHHANDESLENPHVSLECFIFL